LTNTLNSAIIFVKPGTLQIKRRIKKMKKILAFLLTVSLVFSLAACGKGVPAETESTGTVESARPQKDEASKAPEKDPLKIEEIDWTVEEGIIDGKRQAVFGYTNNSQFTIAEIEISFSEKPDVTDEEREAIWTELQTRFELNEDDMADLRANEISMRVESMRVAEPGATISNEDGYYAGGYAYVRKIEHFDLVEPDIASIRYLDNDMIYTVYYDFHTDKYTMDNKVVDAFIWSTYDIGDKVPKPDSKIVDTTWDEDDCFMFEAYGVTLDQFNEYVEECQAMGYDVDKDSFDDYFSADNSEGYSIDIYYHEDDWSMDVDLNAPDEPSTPEPTESETSEPEDGIRPEFKEAMDSYEAFFDEYCEFMEEYKTSSDPASMLADYTDMMQKEVDALTKLDEIGSQEMSDEELVYYTEVMGRINQKLASAA